MEIVFNYQTLTTGCWEDSEGNVVDMPDTFTAMLNNDEITVTMIKRSHRSGENVESGKTPFYVKNGVTAPINEHRLYL